MNDNDDCDCSLERCGAWGVAHDVGSGYYTVQYCHTLRDVEIARTIVRPHGKRYHTHSCARAACDELQTRRRERLRAKWGN